MEKLFETISCHVRQGKVTDKFMQQICAANKKTAEVMNERRRNLKTESKCYRSILTRHGILLQ